MDATREVLAAILKAWDDDAEWTAARDLMERARSVLSQEPGGARRLAKVQPCGCVVCTCENEEEPDRCMGCGAKNCGTHPVGKIPNPVYESPSPGEAPRPTCHACEIEGVTYGSRPREEHDPSADCRYTPVPAPQTELRGRMLDAEEIASAKRFLCESVEPETATAYYLAVLIMEVERLRAPAPSAESDLEALPEEIEQALGRFRACVWNFHGETEALLDLKSAILSALRRRRAGGRT